jgi:hypothetical protein
VPDGRPVATLGAAVGPHAIRVPGVSVHAFLDSMPPTEIHLPTLVSAR